MPELRVRREDIADCRMVEGEPLRDDLGEGEAQLLVERLALSANNITYAIHGDRLGYWKLFPAPLFGTSVLLDLVLDDMGFDAMSSVVLTSASSKTAYGLAHLLRERPVQTVGLTSTARRAWVRELGLYDAVLTYDQLTDLSVAEGAVLVDFAGDPALVRAVHERLADALARSILVGFTHGSANADETPLPGPAPEFFFAPDEIVRRGREFGNRYAEAWHDFAPVAHRTLRIERITDSDELLRLFRDLLDGRADPAVGYIVSL